MNARERLTIFENVIARVGIDGDVLGEYSKAMARMNGFQSAMEMTPPPMTPNLPPEQPNNANSYPDSGGGGLNLPL